jgi:molybdopterin molybdotransferase
MISVETALKLIKNQRFTQETKTVNLINSLNCVVSKDVISPINMPPFQQSAMDGYALNLYNSSIYKIIDEVKAGDGHNPILKSGEAIRIFTGAAVPETANAVVMQEKTNANNGLLELQNIVVKNDNIRPKGEQVKAGEIALKKETQITPATVGFLASLGITEIEVYKQPKITLIVTGNELTTPGQALEYGKIYESNSIMLASAFKSIGYSNISIQQVNDDYSATKTLLDHSINTNDLVIITGGISVGDYDFVGKALNELNVNEVFYKVKQKPGKPLYFGTKNKTSIFALPGNPAAALTCFYVYVYPALQLMKDSDQLQLPTLVATSNSVFEKKGNRAQFLKAIISDNKVTILEGQSSAMLQTFSIANALVYMPVEQDKIAINDKVKVIHLPN